MSRGLSTELATELGTALARMVAARRLEKSQDKEDKPVEARVLRPRPKNSDAVELGAALRAVRQARQLPVDALADQIEKSAPYVRMIERGEKVPAPDTFIKLVGTLGFKASQSADHEIPTVHAIDSEGRKLIVVLEGAAPRSALASRDGLYLDMSASLLSLWQDTAKSGRYSTERSEHPAQLETGSTNLFDELQTAFETIDPLVDASVESWAESIQSAEASHLYREILGELASADVNTLRSVRELLRDARPKV